MRKTPAAKAARSADPVTFSPLTELQKIAGEPLKGTTKDGREVLFGQIRLSDVASMETGLGLSAGAMGNPAYRVSVWSFLAYRSLRHHKPDASPDDIDALFPPTARGIELLGEVMDEVLPRDEEPAEDPAPTGEPS
jgi:hypothetical protein